MKRKLFFSIAWLILCLALATWWVVVAYRLIHNQQLMTESEVSRIQNMLMWEGATWLVLLLSGGATLIYLIVREHRQRSEVQDFVAAFSHDLKTSLASLRLLAEAVFEEASDTPLKELSSRLLGDSIRLQIQLENSLYLANFQRLNLFLETVPLMKLLDSLKNHWPGLQLTLDKDCRVEVDARAIESVLRNIVHNAVVHASAREIQFHARRADQERVEITINNDGRPFAGDIQQVGRKFYRQNPSSGSGLGLFITRELIKKMGGDIVFSADDMGRFAVKIVLAGDCR